MLNSRRDFCKSFRGLLPATKAPGAVSGYADVGIPSPNVCALLWNAAWVAAKKPRRRVTMANQIPTDEFRQRLKNVREAMLRQDLHALVVYSQKRSPVTYFSGYHPNYHTNSALMLITAECDPILWIKFAFDLPRAKAKSWLEDVRACAGEDVGEVIGKCADEIRALKLEASRIGLVGTDLAVDELSFTFREQMCRQLPKAQFVPASNIVNDLRLIKSPNEIALLRQCAQVAEVGVDSLRKAIRPGIKDYQATLAAEHAVKLEGADQCDFFISTDPALRAFPPSGHEFKTPSSVTFEITVRYAGYWVQICRVFSLGKPTKEQTLVFEVARDAYQAEVRAARPGASLAQVAEAAQGVITAGGFKDCTPYGLGHGIGLDIPELYPVDKGCTSRLAPGIIIILHPSIWAPNEGAVYFGGPVAVTDHGALQLDNPVSEIIEI
jgi:Xaa-Pro aminopeptidase